MREVVYSVAASLDGYIARPDGSYDWIPEEPAFDWAAFLRRFDTVLMGRRTYEVVAARGGEGPASDMETIVFSSTLSPDRHPEVDVTSADPAEVVEELRGRPGRDVWLMGGGRLFRSLLERGGVDRVEVGVVPVLPGDGIPVLPSWEGEARLELIDATSYPGGMVMLRYRLREPSA